MPTGEASDGAFTDGQMREITTALRTANTETGLHFSVFVGNSEGPARDYAERLLAGLRDRAEVGVLTLVDPGRRRLEIVTGESARRRVPDRACALAALSMRTAFAGGDLVGGTVTGVRMLAEAAGGSRALATGSHTASHTGSDTVSHTGSDTASTTPAIGAGAS